jgi:hypothetical protein
MFLGLPDPNPLGRGMDPAPDTVPDKEKNKNSKKNLDSFCFMAYLRFFIFGKLCKSSFEKLISKKLRKKIYF